MPKPSAFWTEGFGIIYGGIAVKKFKIISNIITLFILVGGLVPCAASYINHSLYCHGCSSHSSHPTVELMIYGLVILFAGSVFGISRLIYGRLERGRLLKAKARPREQNWKEPPIY